MKLLINMSVLTFLSMFLCCINLLSCKERINNTEEKLSKNYLNSKVFRDQLQYYEEKENFVFGEKIGLLLKGEEGFLNCENYEFYIIYFYKLSGENNVKLFTFKSYQNTPIQSIKIYSDVDPQLNLREKEFINDYMQVETLVRKVDVELANRFKKKLDNLLNEEIQEVDMPEYHDPIRIAFYYDGEEFRYISDFLIGKNKMNIVDSMFRKSSLF